MNQQFHKNDSFRNEIGFPPPEFEIPEDYEQKWNEEDIQTPDTPIRNTPRTEQPTQTPDQPTQTSEPTPEGATIKEDPRITEIPTDAPRKQSGSRELKNLKSGLDGDSWKPCSVEHGRRLRVRAVDFKDEDEFQEMWDNVRLLDAEEDTESNNEPVEKRDW